MCPCRLERVSWPFDASVSAMIAYDLIFGAAAFAGLGAGVSDLFSHIEQINSGLPANWGRILCAMGYSGAQFDPEKVDLFFESVAGHMQIIKDGVAVDYSEEEATRILSEPEVTAIADIKMGDAQATAWGCDLTFDYVKINADYRS